MTNDLLRFQGANYFRHRLLLASLSGRTIRIDGIRSTDTNPGLRDYEANFLRLLEKMTNGSRIDINYTGTTLVYRPGALMGGQIDHECCLSQPIAYYLEPLMALAPFCKKPLILTLQGITEDLSHVSIDALRTVSLPLLNKFGVGDLSHTGSLLSGGANVPLELKIVKRGAVPLGGGQVFFQCPVVRLLRTIDWCDEGRILRIRGMATATRISPQMANRAVESARSVLNRYIPDIFIYTDASKGQDAGKSPGFSLSLVAESTTGARLGADHAVAATREESTKEKETGSNESSFVHSLKSLQREIGQSALQQKMMTAEDLGIFVAHQLLDEIARGGCVDASRQWLVCLLMVLCPENVSRVRVGPLTPFTMQFLRDLQSFFGVTFKISTVQRYEMEEDDMSLEPCVLLTCVGVGYQNYNKRSA